MADAPMSAVSAKSPMGLGKLKPSKPPRKFVPAKSEFDEPAYEPVERKYEEVQIRNNAWQTLGIDSPNHTEQVNEDEGEQDYMSWGEVRRGIEAVRQPPASAIMPHNAPSDVDSAYYDKLNHFGSSSKLNVNSPYKQVFPIPVNPVELPSFNEYDEVRCVETEESGEEKRKADVAHQFHNDEAYAVISKPKRV